MPGRTCVAVVWGVKEATPSWLGDWPRDTPFRTPVASGRRRAAAWSRRHRYSAKCQPERQPEFKETGGRLNCYWGSNRRSFTRYFLFCFLALGGAWALTLSTPLSLHLTQLTSFETDKYKESKAYRVKVQILEPDWAEIPPPTSLNSFMTFSYFLYLLSASVSQPLNGEKYSNSLRGCCIGLNDLMLHTYKELRSVPATKYRMLSS